MISSGKGTRALAITKRSKMGALVTLWLKGFGFSGYSHRASPDLATIVEPYKILFHSIKRFAFEDRRPK